MVRHVRISRLCFSIQSRRSGARCCGEGLGYARVYTNTTTSCIAGKKHIQRSHHWNTHTFFCHQEPPSPRLSCIPDLFRSRGPVLSWWLVSSANQPPLPASQRQARSKYSQHYTTLHKPFPTLHPIFCTLPHSVADHFVLRRCDCHPQSLQRHGAVAQANR